MTLAELRVDVVVLACAISAGVHAALVPEHLSEGLGPGVSFAVSAALLAAAVVVLTRRPSPCALLAAALLLGGLVAAYALTVAAGIPVVHPEREPVAGLALATKAVEAAGLLAALGRRPSLSFLSPKGSLT